MVVWSRCPAKVKYVCWFSLVVAQFLVASPSLGQEKSRPPAGAFFSQDNLIAWCIVPFDSKKRGPEERATMLARLGIRRFAYDWRAEHLTSFEAEVSALRRHNIKLDAVWFPASLNADARTILAVLGRNGIRTQLWVTLGDPAPQAKSDAERVGAAVRVIRPLAHEATKIGCSVGLYNHGGWFGEPENQIAILNSLREPNVGIVYNLHHGHAHIDRLPDLLAKIIPHLYALNLNGMARDGERNGQKILPLGQGELDLRILKIIANSGFRGPFGILGHTMNDAEDQLRDNLDGLNWLVSQLDGGPAGAKPRPRTPVPSLAPSAVPSVPARGAGQSSSGLSPVSRRQGTGARESLPKNLPYDQELVARLVAQSKAQGDVRRGAAVFSSPQFACLSCHKLGSQGGTVGPEVTLVGRCLPPTEIVESVLWPKRKIREGYSALMVITSDGKMHTGYKERETEKALVLRDPVKGVTLHIPKADIEERQDVGTLMPDGLATAMSAEQLRDLFRFLMGLGVENGVGEGLMAHSVAARFSYDRAPLDPEDSPSWKAYVNRDRLYDFYAKEARHFKGQPDAMLLPEFPGLDGTQFGHWGNQGEAAWADGRWNETELGSVQCGVFRAPGVVVPRAVCVRLGDRGELATCFNPESLCYEALWQDGFLQFSSVRHGFLDGLAPRGNLLPRPEGKKPDRPFMYHGFYRHGKRIIFSYRLGDEEILDAPWVENGRFVRLVGPAHTHPLSTLINGGPAQWPEVFKTTGALGRRGAYAIDTITPPLKNPWKSLLFFGDHDFTSDGTAYLCTIQGDVWRVDGLDEQLKNVCWRRIASGLHQALGLVVANGQVYVLGRDQITCLHDLNGDGEADFYECFSSAYETSPAGHDFICGLQRDSAGRFYSASSKQGLLRISADGTHAEVLATGFRNPDGLGLLPEGSLTVPCSEGDWTPASMICLLRPNITKANRQARGVNSAHVTEIPHFGYGGPKNGEPPQLPLVYLPRGLDNSSGGQVHVTSERWGPMHGKLIHFSYGAAKHFLILTDEVEGQSQGAIVPLPGEFLSGVHRGRFNPKDGQLYVTGMGGWGTYSVADGCFQRVRYTGQDVQLPVQFHAHENGVRISFTRPLDAHVAGAIASHFAQAWNYRYSSAYGSPEYSTRHPGTPGHDVLAIARAHVFDDGRTLFLEMPDLQPVNQLHLHIGVATGQACDLYATIHSLGRPFTNLPDYRPRRKLVAAHPILADLALNVPRAPNPWRKGIKGARSIVVAAGKNLSFDERSLIVRAGEPIRLTFRNPDVVPHNWILVAPGTLNKVGDLVNKLVAEPDAVARHYVPRSDDVLVYTDIVGPGESFTIHFRAPLQKGRYPYLCSFPGHWMVMNGQMIVK
jgi:putative heme-binding domain-containing protein